MTAVAEHIDFDLLEREVDDKIRQLEQARQRLSLEVVRGDAEAAQELESVVSGLEAARGEKMTLELARAEHARRQLEAEKEARAAAQEAAFNHARRLQVDRERAVRGIDSAAVKLACALADYRRVCAGQGLALTQAGLREDIRSGVRLLPLLIEGAIKFQLREQRVESVLDLPPLPAAHTRPLRDSDPKILEPLRDEESK